jgi:HEAT repeat protein
LLKQLSDRPGGNIDILWRGRSVTAIEADLDQIGSDAVSPLIDALSDPNPTIRYLAAGQLGRLGDSQAVDALIVSTRDTNRIVQFWAVSALGDIRDPKALDTLIPFLQHEDHGLRFRAAQALGQIGDNRAYEALLPLLKDKKLYPQAYAAEAIGRLGDERALPVLITILNSENDSWVRSMAANGLKYLGMREAISALKLASEDESEKVRNAINNALLFLNQETHNEKKEN